MTGLRVLIPIRQGSNDSEIGCVAREEYTQYLMNSVQNAGFTIRYKGLQVKIMTFTKQFLGDVSLEAFSLNLTLSPIIRLRNPGYDFGEICVYKMIAPPTQANVTELSRRIHAMENQDSDAYLLKILCARVHLQIQTGNIFMNLFPTLQMSPNRPNL